jgi:hypothetical protein
LHDDDFAGGFLKAATYSCALALVDALAEYAHSRIARGGRDFDGAVLRAIVDHDDFFRVWGRKYAVEQSLDGGFLVVAGHDHGQALNGGSRGYMVLTHRAMLAGCDWD